MADSVGGAGETFLAVIPPEKQFTTLASSSVVSIGGRL